MQKIRDTEQRARENKLAVDNILFLNNGIKYEVDEAFVVAQHYEKLMKWQEFNINNFEKEHGRSIRGQDIESIE